MADISQLIGGILFKSPFIVASGPLSDRLDLIKKAEECGAGAVSIKRTDWSQSKQGVRKMYSEKGKYFFNPSDRRLELDETVNLLHQVKRSVDMPVFANILGDGDDTETWVSLGMVMQEAGADALELNFACPNPKAQSDQKAKMGAAISSDPDMVFSIVSALTSVLKIPVWVKFSGEGVNSINICRTAQKAGAAGLVLFSSPRGAFPIDIYNSGRPKIADLKACSFGGINGPAIRAMSNRVVAEVSNGVPGIPVMGGGGISSFSDAVETIMFGASLTFSFTHIMLEGFDVISKMNRQLISFMDEYGYQSIEDMRGLALKNLINNSELDPSIGPPAKIDTSRCIGCGICERIAFCRAISMQNNKAVVENSLCECCGLCASVCPKNAIYFSKEVLN